MEAFGSKYRSGPTTIWLKTKCFTVGGFELLGVERERGKPAVTQWVKPGIKACVKHLRGEEDLRHASLQDFREDN